MVVLKARRSTHPRWLGMEIMLYLRLQLSFSELQRRLKPLFEIKLTLSSCCHTKTTQNVVYCIAFNNPFGDKIVTGSFDKTAKIWDANNGKLLHTLHGHQYEIVCLSFDPQGMLVATGSMVTYSGSLFLSAKLSHIALLRRAYP